jgi:hypothetical protein
VDVKALPRNPWATVNLEANSPAAPTALERGGAADRGPAEMRRSGEVPTLAATSADLLDATPARVWQPFAMRAGVRHVVSLP